jgi:hypothetical protein
MAGFLRSRLITFSTLVTGSFLFIWLGICLGIMWWVFSLDDEWNRTVF